MTDAPTAELPFEASKRPALKYYLLALAVMPMFSGVLPIIGRVSVFGLRGLWLSFCVLVFAIGWSLPMRRLMNPMVPYLGWLLAYLTLGVLASPVPSLPRATTMFFYTVVFSTTMAIFSSRPDRLRLFANSAQWILFFNLLFLLLVIKDPSYQSIVNPTIDIGDAYMADKERFAGLWGNPNMAGYVCIIAIILSTWATRWIAWIGRVSGVTIIYYSASRKSFLILLIIIVLNLILVQRKNIRLWIMIAVGALALLLLSLFGSRFLGSSVSKLSQDQKISRMVDLTEKNESEDGSRVDLFKRWLPIAAKAPWYGYGLGSMAGSDPNAKTPRKELFSTGTHNTYLGLWIDIGPLGLVSFLCVFGYYIYKALVARYSPPVRWSLLSLMICNVLILTVSHSHLEAAEGLIAFSLLFLLPSCPALKDAPA
jgi:O-antigen ligase